MFNRIKLRLQDMRTLGKLIPGADKEAQIMGEEEPGAEHFLLSALKLPDGSAQRIFSHIGAKPEQLQIAIQNQYQDALQSMGIETKLIDNPPEAVTSDRLFHNAKPSGQAVMKELYALKRHDKDRPLLGAHVVDVVARMQYGVAARAFKALGIEQNTILAAVREELDAYH